MEWLLLAVLIPAIVIPVVLLFGFAGCQLVFPLNPGPPPAPINLAAVPRRTSVTLTWENQLSNANTTFRVERTAGQAAPVLLDATSTTLEDTGLAEATNHTYRVLAVVDEQESAFSAPLTVATTGFEPAFTETLGSDGAGLAGDCRIQRIEPLRLFKSGSEIRLTIASATTAPLAIDRIFISRVGTQGDPYDAAPDLTPVAVDLSLPANTVMTLPPVSYALDHTQPLLIAVDFNATAGTGNVRRRTNVPAAEATLFGRNNSAQADLPDRAPDFIPNDQIILVTLIEVA
jgi:hypothetical protein